MTGATCPICGESFASANGVRDHTWDAHGACHHCGDGFDRREYLYAHWLEAHEADLTTESRKRAERAVGDGTVCPGCGERFGDDAALYEHARDAHGVCHRCGESFDDEDLLTVHLSAAHGEELSRPVREQIDAADVDLGFGDRLAHRGPAAAVRGVGVSRRALLGGGAAVAVAGAVVAGGVFGGGGPSIESHPATAALASQPSLGPPPRDAEGTIVAFEDPSCPSCARFELGTFPELESRLVDSGSVSFVYRGIPVVQPWGEPAVLALESTYVRDAAAFWSLKEFYYRSQGEIGSTETVETRTRQFLAEETDLNVGAVMEDVEAERHRDAVDTDLRAAREADVPGTPTFYLFRDGSYVTEVVGPQPYEVFANSLGL